MQKPKYISIKQDKIRISDIWSFGDYILKDFLTKIAGLTGYAKCLQGL
jgi:hypothetical protein